MLDGICNLPGMGTRNFGHRISLSHNKQVLYFTNVIFRVALDRIPEVCSAPHFILHRFSDLLYDQKISRVGFMSEQRCSDKIVVQRGYSLSRVDVAKLHER